MSETNGTTSHVTPSLPATMLRTFSALVNRLGLANRIGSLYDGRRKMHEVLGYKARLTYGDFKARYLRQDLAHRIIKAFPEATWAQPPTFEEADDGATEQPTPFEAAWTTLATRLMVYANLERTDMLANLGQYAVVLIGLRGQSDLRTPARPVRSPDDVLYLEPYSEEWAEIAKLDSDPGSPTFGKPLEYRINFSRNTGMRERVALAAGRAVVHASRIIHVAEDVLDDEIYGIPRMEPIFDRLDDLLKVVGGSAEMYWRDARRRIVYETREGYALGAQDEASVKDQAEEFAMDMTDWIRVEGVDVKSLAGRITSPKEHYEVLVSILAATTGIPRRILEGSERGQLASQQDQEAWLGRVTRRQQQFAEPRMLRPLVDRLITLRALPPPVMPYVVAWENLFSLSEDQQVGIAQKVATALNQYAGPGMASTIVPPQQWVETYLGIPYVASTLPLMPEEL